MSYTVKIGFTSGDQSYSILKGSIETYVGAEGKHATQSTPVKVKSAACAALLLTETASMIPATVYHNSTVIFEGYIRPYRSVGAKNATEDPVSLQIMDSTEYMHRVTGTDVVYSNKTVAQLVTLIYAASGASPTLGTIPAALSSFSIDRLRVSSEEYWDEILAELLYEYGYDYFFTPGYCQIQKTTIDADPNQSITDIRNNYKVQKNDNTIDGTIVEYKKTAYRQNVRLYSDDTRYDATKTGFGTHKTGNYYNGLMHDDQESAPLGNLVYWDFPGTGLADLKASNVLSVSNVNFDFELEDEDGIDLTENFDTAGSDLLTGARWWLHYDGTFNRVFGVGWGWIVRAYGDVMYLVDGNWQYRCEGLDPKKYSAKYVTNEDAAKAMAEREYKRFKVCHTKYSFDSLTDYNVGEFYNLEETTVGVDTVVRILSKSLSSDGIYTYECEGADIVGLSVTVEELQVRDIDAAGGMLKLTLSTDTISFPTDNVTATLSGYVTSQAHIGFKWYINGTLFAIGQQIRVFNQTVFVNGKNTIKAEVWHTAEDSSDHDVLLVSAEAELENLGNPIVEIIPQYYHSASIDSLAPNVFVETADTSKQAGKIYYEKQYTPDSGYVVTEDSSFISGKTYYEDASWMEEIINSTGNGYYVNGRLVPTKDTSKQNDKIYYYYDETEEEYVEFEGSTFDPDTIYYEFEENPSYVWHRQKYIYSNGDIVYSFYAYYLTTADVANPFTITTEFATSTSSHFVVTQDSTPNSGKIYYTNVTGRWRIVSATEGTFPSGMDPNDIYEIENVGTWSQDAIPSSWRKGLYIWVRETVTYENQPDNAMMQIPYYSAYHTQEMEKTCRFEGNLQDYSWNKNLRSVASDDVSVTVDLNIVGYGQLATPIVRGLPQGVTVTSNNGSVVLHFDSSLEASSLSFSIGLLYPTQDTTPQNNKTYYYYDSTNNVWAIFSGSTFAVGVTYYEDYAGVEALTYTIKSVDVTERGMYLGMINALPSDPNMTYLDGDHFVLTENITVASVDYYKFMPYVYSSGSWVAVQEGQTYGTETSVQIMYNCAKDIYQNADYVYEDCESGDVAEAGKTYYNKVTHLPVIVAVGEDVSSYCTRYLNVPQEVITYYNYQEKLMAEHIVAEDIELARGGQIRSAGYVKGTARTIMNEMAEGHSVDNYQPGFYGDYDGNFEAYAATLVDANIYYCNIVGELRNELFETVTKPQTGSQYIQNILVDESWSGTTAIALIKAVLAADGKGEYIDGAYNGLYEVVSMGCHYPQNSSSYVHNFGLIVEDILHEHTSGSISGDGTFTMPIKADVTVTEGEFWDSTNNKIVNGDTIVRNTVLKNVKRWNIKDIYNHSSLSKNNLYSASGSYNGTSFNGLACVSSVSATAIGSSSRSRSYTGGYNTAGDWTWTVPSVKANSGKTRTISLSGKLNGGITKVLWTTYMFAGNVTVWKNGSVVYGPTGDISGATDGWHYGDWSCSFSAKAGDTIRVRLESSGTDRSPANISNAEASNGTRTGYVDCTYGAMTFNGIGCSSNGAWIYRNSTWTNLGTDQERYQSTDSINSPAHFTGQPLSMTSPISWASADHALSAQLKYNFSKYNVGLNLVVADGSQSAFIQAQMYPIASYFDCVYDSLTVFNSANTQHYFHINSSPLKTGSTPVQSGKVFSVDYGQGVAHQFSYQRAGEALATTGSDIKSVIWSSTSITIERTNGLELLTIGQSSWYVGFTIDFTALARVRGNYSGSIFPMESEADRTTPIKLGLADNRFDELHTKMLGNRLQGTEEGYMQNLNLIPHPGITSFETGVTYYYFTTAGILTTETAGSPVSERLYFTLGANPNYAYFDTLAMLDSVDSQRKRVDSLFLKISQIEQTLSGSADKIPSSAAVNDAIMNIKSGLLKHANTGSITTDGDGDYRIDSIVNGTTKIPIALKCSNNNPSALPYVFYATGGSVFIRFFKRDNTGNAANTSIGVVTVYYLDFT